MKKLINLTLLFLLILGIYSCLKDEFQLSGSNEKSAGDEKELIEVAQDWYLTNPSKNDYSLIHVSEKLKWSQAIVHQLDTATIVEIPIKLKENNSLKIKYEYELNIEQRLLIINNGNQTYSLLEFFISTDSKENLSNIKKLNFIENKDYFEGTLLLVNSAGESVIAKQIENVEESAEFKLKSIEVRCLVLVYEYSDGTYDIISVLYCYEIDNGVDGGGGGDPSYVDPHDCNCNICSDCGGCIIDELKSIPIPPEDGGETDETDLPCPMCTCPQTLERIARSQLEYLKQRGESELALVYETLLSDGNIPMEDVYKIYSSIENAYHQLKFEYLGAIFSVDNVSTILGLFYLGDISAITEKKALSAFANWESRLINPANTAILRNGYYEVNGFKFSEYYYNYCWSNGRYAPSLIVREVLENATSIYPDSKPGFFVYIYQNLRLVYNPVTKEVWHISPF